MKFFRRVLGIGISLALLTSTAAAAEVGQINEESAVTVSTEADNEISADEFIQQETKVVFEDVDENSFYYTPVYWALDNGITTGTSSTTFSPFNSCTRGEFVTFLWRAAGCPKPEMEEDPFTDVPSGKYYTDAVLWAYENEITTGVGEGIFAPSAIVSRAQVVTFIWRYMECPDAEEETCPFSDVSSGSYYYEPVMWAAQNGVTTGTSATKFSPNDVCSRAQVVTFLYRALDGQEVIEDFNYLAIGNSITKHNYADYWWDNDRGMAASEDSKDYVHIIKAYLESTGKNVNMDVRNLLGWETISSGRTEAMLVIEPYLYEDLDLVTVQLGESAADLTTWEEDFESLIIFIKEKAPDAEIVVIGDFWSYSNRDELKEEAARAQGVTYVSLDGIKGNEEYYAGLGTVVQGKYGEEHIIEQEWVAKHPSDKGMAAIAERVIAALETIL